MSKITQSYIISKQINQYPWNLSKLKKSLKRRKWFRIKFNSKLLKKRFYFKKKSLKTYENKTKNLFKKFFAPSVSNKQFKKIFKIKKRFRSIFKNILKLEYRVDTLIFRIFFLNNINFSRYCIENNFFLLNSKNISNPKIILNLGDIIEINNKQIWFFLYNYFIKLISSIKKYYNRLFFKLSYPFISKKKKKLFKEDKWSKKRALRHFFKKLKHKQLIIKRNFNKKCLSLKTTKNNRFFYKIEYFSKSKGIFLKKRKPKYFLKQKIFNKNSILLNKHFHYLKPTLLNILLYKKRKVKKFKYLKLINSSNKQSNLVYSLIKDKKKIYKNITIKSSKIISFFKIIIKKLKQLFYKKNNELKDDKWGISFKNIKKKNVTKIINNLFVIYKLITSRKFNKCSIFKKYSTLKKRLRNNYIKETNKKNDARKIENEINEFKKTLKKNKKYSNKEIKRKIYKKRKNLKKNLKNTKNHSYSTKKIKNEIKNEIKKNYIKRKKQKKIHSLFENPEFIWEFKKLGLSVKLREKVLKWVKKTLAKKKNINKLTKIYSISALAKLLKNNKNNKKSTKMKNYKLNLTLLTLIKFFIKNKKKIDLSKKSLIEKRCNLFLFNYKLTLLKNQIKGIFLSLNNLGLTFNNRFFIKKYIKKKFNTFFKYVLLIKKIKFKKYKYKIKNWLKKKAKKKKLYKLNNNKLLAKKLKINNKGWAKKLKFSTKKYNYNLNNIYKKNSYNKRIRRKRKPRIKKKWWKRKKPWWWKRRWVRFYWQQNRITKKLFIFFEFRKKFNNFYKLFKLLQNNKINKKVKINNLFYFDNNIFFNKLKKRYYFKNTNLTCNKKQLKITTKLIKLYKKDLFFLNNTNNLKFNQFLSLCNLPANIIIFFKQFLLIFKKKRKINKRIYKNLLNKLLINIDNFKIDYILKIILKATNKFLPFYIKYKKKIFKICNIFSKLRIFYLLKKNIFIKNNKYINNSKKVSLEFICRIKRKYIKIKGGFRKFNGYKIEIALPKEKTSKIQIEYKKIYLINKYRPKHLYFVEINYNTLSFVLIGDLDFLNYPYRTMFDFNTISRFFSR